MAGDAAGVGPRQGLAIELVPNCSLTIRQASAFFASLCAVSFTIAGIFVLHGFYVSLQRLVGMVAGSPRLGAAVNA